MAGVDCSCVKKKKLEKIRKNNIKTENPKKKHFISK